MQPFEGYPSLEPMTPTGQWQAIPSGAHCGQGDIAFSADEFVASVLDTAKVMIVDDEPVNVKIVQKYLKLAGYRHFVTSYDPCPAVDLIEREMPDVILLDIMMPGISGLDILRAIRQKSQLIHVPMIVLTAADNEETKLEALQLGATDFLGKPVNAAELVMRVRNALIVKAHHDHLKNYSQELERCVRQRTAELAESRLELIHCLARATEFRDNSAPRHVPRVGRYAEVIARAMGIDDQMIKNIGSAAPLHEMGEFIQLAGRITVAADVFDALSNTRPYKPAFPLDKCFEIIREGSGSHFDPQVVDAVLSCTDAIAAVRAELSDAS